MLLFEQARCGVLCQRRTTRSRAFGMASAIRCREGNNKVRFEPSHAAKSEVKTKRKFGSECNRLCAMAEAAQANWRTLTGLGFHGTLLGFSWCAMVE